MNDTATPSVRRPSALWAGLLSLFQSGLGHVYAGARTQGWVLFAISIALYGLAAAITRLTAPEPTALAIFLVLAAIGVLFRLGVAVAAIRLVRRGAAQTLGQPWHRSTWFAALEMVVAAVAVAGLFSPNGSDPFGWRSFRINSGSMLPTLTVGDYAMVDIRDAGSLPLAGEVVIFRHPQNQAYWVKRVVAVDAHTVQMRGGVLQLDGRPVPRSAVAGQSGRYRETLPNGRSYDIFQKTVNGPSDDTMTFRIPPASFFVLGDYRDDSIDSRHNSLGMVPKANLTGVMYTVYWSKDFSRLFLRIR
jgi:signal peptidase I